MYESSSTLSSPHSGGSSPILSTSTTKSSVYGPLVANSPASSQNFIFSSEISPHSPVAPKEPVNQISDHLENVELGSGISSQITPNLAEIPSNSRDLELGTGLIATGHLQEVHRTLSSADVQLGSPIAPLSPSSTPSALNFSGNNPICSPSQELDQISSKSSEILAAATIASNSPACKISEIPAEMSPNSGEISQISEEISPNSGNLGVTQELISTHHGSEPNQHISDRPPSPIVTSNPSLPNPPPSLSPQSISGNQYPSLNSPELDQTLPNSSEILSETSVEPINPSHQISESSEIPTNSAEISQYLTQIPPNSQAELGNSSPLSSNNSILSQISQELYPQELAVVEVNQTSQIQLPLESPPISPGALSSPSSTISSNNSQLSLVDTLSSPSVIELLSSTSSSSHSAVISPHSRITYVDSGDNTQPTPPTIAPSSPISPASPALSLSILDTPILNLSAPSSQDSDLPASLEIRPEASSLIVTLVTPGSPQSPTPISQSNVELIVTPPHSPVSAPVVTQSPASAPVSQELVSVQIISSSDYASVNQDDLPSPHTPSPPKSFASLGSSNGSDIIILPSPPVLLLGSQPFRSQNAPAVSHTIDLVSSSSAVTSSSAGSLVVNPIVEPIDSPLLLFHPALEASAIVQETAVPESANTGTVHNPSDPGPSTQAEQSHPTFDHLTPLISIRQPNSAESAPLSPPPIPNQWLSDLPCYHSGLRSWLMGSPTPNPEPEITPAEESNAEPSLNNNTNVNEGTTHDSTAQVNSAVPGTSTGTGTQEEITSNNLVSGKLKRKEPRLAASIEMYGPDDYLLPHMSPPSKVTHIGPSQDSIKKKYPCGIKGHNYRGIPFHIPGADTGSCST